MSEEKKELKKLSPSRIETLGTCSWSYWCNYHLMLPNESNSGSATGSAVHNLCETLAKNRKKHESKVNKIIEAGTVKAAPAVDRYLKILCAKEGYPYSREILNKDKSAIVLVEDYVDPFVVVALKEEFYGREGEETLVELEHTLDYEDQERGLRFIVRGFIDKVHIKKNKRGTVTSARVRDYKTSKTKFDISPKGKVLHQNLIYTMFAKDLWKKAKEFSMEYIFLQFPKNPMLIPPQVDDDIIEGYKYYLSDVFKKVNNFTINDAYEKFAADDYQGKFLCGKDGFASITDKKTKRKIQTEFPAWKCIYKDPYEYFALSKNGKILRTAKKQEDLKLTQEENMGLIGGELKLEKMWYKGCPAYWSQE